MQSLIISLIGIISLMTLVAVRAQPMKKTGLIAIFILSFTTVNVLTSFKEDFQFYVDVWPTQLVLGYSNGLKKILENDRHCLLIIDAASRPTHGIDFEELRFNLAEKKNCDLLPMGFGGGDYFERNRLHQIIIDQLSERQKKLLVNRHVVILREFQRNYDVRPLTWFKKFNQKFTNRAFSYLSIPIASKAYYSTVLSMNEDRENKKLASLGYELLSHGMVHELNVGLLHRYKKFNTEQYPMPTQIFYDQKSPGFEFKGLGGLIASAKAYSMPTDWNPPAWLQKIRDPMFDEVWGKYKDTQLFFTMPSTQINDLTYTLNFCEFYKTRECILPWHDEIMRKLDRTEFWQNGGHVLKKAVPITTAWLSESILASDSFK